MKGQLARLAKKGRKKRGVVRRDLLSRKERSLRMSKIRSRDTNFEKLVIPALRKAGVRFRTHYRGIIGTPDIVNTKKKVAIFLDSDFWHGWRYPAWKNNLSKSWSKKILQNRLRDRRVTRRLRSSGWKVIRVWEHQLATDYAETLRDLKRILGTIS
ncbi:DNA mismatch endonuclease Vsr [Patescibacteria group bacterium]|nr:MAG: DNA mismatch endonuclease Vsr [Patescibacteria group bacterium]